MWHRYARRTIGWLCPSSSRCKGVQTNHRGIEGDHWAQCARVRTCREKCTLIQRQSWGLSNDSGLRMVKWESKSKNPPKTDTFIEFYLFVLCSITCQKTCHFTACLTYIFISVFISVFYVNTARNVITVLLRFARYLSLYLHIFICSYRGTHTQTHMHNQHTRGIATTRHKSLVERGSRKAFVRDKGLAQKKKKGKQKVKKTQYSRIWRKGFKHIEIF